MNSKILSNFELSFEKFTSVLTHFVWEKHVLQPCAIENLHLGVAKQVSVAVGWVKIKILLMAQLKGLTAKFKLM